MSFSPKQVQAAQQHLHDVVTDNHGVDAFTSKPADPNGGWTGGTPNMRRLERTLRGVDWDEWQGLLGFLKLEEADGFELQEPFPGTHDHLNYGAAGVGLKVAHDRGNKPLVAALVRWFQKAFHLCRLMDAGKIGKVDVGPWGPGARASDGGPLQGSNMGRTLAYRVAQGQKVRPKQLADKGNVGALALSLLPRDLLASLLEEPAEFRLCSELRVARRQNKFGTMATPMPGDYVAWYPNGIAGAVDVALSAWVWDGKLGIARDANVMGMVSLFGAPVVIPGVSQKSAG